jgi:hypothetical protein
MTVHRERCRIRGFAHGHQRRRFTSASRLLSRLHWLGGRRYQWQTAYVGGRIPPQILGHRDTCPVKGALIGKQISLALRPLLHQLDSADEEKPRCGSSKQLLPCRSPCDLSRPGPVRSYHVFSTARISTSRFASSSTAKRISSPRFTRLPTTNFVLVWIPHHRDGLPVPMKATGQYRDDKGKDKLVFREGDILVREGPANVPLRHAHWREILQEHNERIRTEAEKTAQAMLRTFLDERARATSPRAPTPLLMDMDGAIPRR